MAPAGAATRQRTPEGGPYDEARLAELALIERMGQRTWLGRTADGTPVAGRWLCRSSGQAGAAVDLAQRAAELSTVVVPALVPVLGSVRRDGAFWLVSELDRGVSLRRLLQVARLAPAQATVIAAGLFAAVDALHAAGHVHGRLHSGNVHVGPGAEVRLVDWGATAIEGSAGTDGRRTDARRAVDLAAAALVVAHLRRAAGRAGGRDDGTRADLLAALERAAAASGLAARRAGRAAEDLEAALGGPDDRTAAKRVLAEVVAAVPRSRQGWPGTVPPAARKPTRRRRVRRAIRTLWSPARKVALALVVLAAVLGTDALLLGDQVRRNIGALARPDPTADQRAAAAGAAALDRPPAPLPDLSLATPPIAAVDVRMLDRCRPGSACMVLVQVRVLRQSTPLEVAWTFRIIDRCGGAEVDLPGSAALVPAGADRVIRLTSVPMPPWRAAEVVAVTTEPVPVAARPLPLAGGDGSC